MCFFNYFARHGKSSKTIEFYRWKWHGCPKDFVGDSEAARRLFCCTWLQIVICVFPKLVCSRLQSNNKYVLWLLTKIWKRQDVKAVEHYRGGHRDTLEAIPTDVLISYLVSHELVMISHSPAMSTHPASAVSAFPLQLQRETCISTEPAQKHTHCSRDSSYDSTRWRLQWYWNVLEFWPRTTPPRAMLFDVCWMDLCAVGAKLEVHRFSRA